MKQIRLFTGGHKFHAEDFTHIQEGYLQELSNIIRGLNGDATSLTILSGVVVSGAVGAMTWTEGYVYFADNLYFIPVQAAPVDGAAWSLHITEVAEANNPLMYKDGATHDVHVRTEFVLQNDLAGSFNASVLLDERKLIDFVGDSLVSSTFKAKQDEAAWENLITPSGVGTVDETPQIRRIGNLVEVRGLFDISVDSGSYAFPDPKYKPTDVGKNILYHNPNGAGELFHISALLVSTGFISWDRFSGAEVSFPKKMCLDNFKYWIR